MPLRSPPAVRTRPGLARVGAPVLACLLALCALPALAAAQTAEPDKLYLTVHGQEITDADITPPPEAVDRNRRARSPEAFQQWFAETRVDNLRKTVMGLLQDRYLAERDVHPPERHIRGALLVLQRSRVEALERMDERLEELARLRAESVARGELTPSEVEAEERVLRERRRNLERLINRQREIRGMGTRLAIDDAERQRAVAMVNAWLLRKHVHEEFGGRVGRVNASWEPIDAYRDWIWTMEESGEIVFADAITRQWLYETLRFGNVPLVEPPADAFADPPWADMVPIPPDPEPAEGAPVPADDEADDAEDGGGG